MLRKCIGTAAGLLIGATTFVHAAAIEPASCSASRLAPAFAALDLGKTATLDSVKWIAAASQRSGPYTVAVPEHCEVKGTIGAHRGPPDDTKYGNHFVLRIPRHWQGRFVFEGGGGNDGVVGSALGMLKNGDSALAQGYAVAAQDSGHTGRSAQFALDKQAYLDFAYEGIHDVARASKALLNAVAGAPPTYAYFVGCSNGGREALVSAQRYPDFDGVVAGAPGFAVYDQWLANMAVLKTIARAAGVRPDAVPTDTSHAFTDAQLSYAANYFMDKCDRLDGIKDGLISNYLACKATPADYAALQCKADGGGSDDQRCLSAVQTQALRDIYTGLVDAHGKVIFPGFLPGGIETKLRGPYIGASAAAPVGAFYSLMENFYFMGYGFQGYPGVSGPADKLVSYPANAVAYVSGFDVNRDSAALGQGRLDFHGSNTDPSRPGPNFDAFHKRGGKLLMYTGSADHGVQVTGVMGLMDRIEAQYKDASDMARLYVIPGMDHCRGGATVDQFDQLAPLAAWVERGVAPGALLARTLPGSPLDVPGTSVSRPLCTYPAYAKYIGGDPANAASYTCSVQ